MIVMQFAQTSYVIFEATVINTLVEYWGYNQSPAILISSMSSNILEIVVH